MRNLDGNQSERDPDQRKCRDECGRASAGSMSIGPICILHDEDDLNVRDGDPYIPE
jgi:hypothetical protein